MNARLSHIAVPVPDYREACKFYARLVGASEVRVSQIPELGIINAFVAIGDRVYFEIIQNESGPVRVFDDVFGHGQQMMCFECEDVAATVAQLKEDGFTEHIINLPQNPKTPSIQFDRTWVKRSARGDFSMELVPTGAVADLYAAAEVVRVEDL